MVTQFLATVVGWYLIIFGLFLIVRRENVRSLMTEVLAEPALLFIMAIMTLIVGLLLVISHNVWIMGWSVVLTLFAWLVLFGGLMRLFFPSSTVKIGRTFLAHPAKITVTGVVLLIIGLLLLFKVYFMGF